VLSEKIGGRSDRLKGTVGYRVLSKELSKDSDRQVFSKELGRSNNRSEKAVVT
jgi:hypothetical protein